MQYGFVGLGQMGGPMALNLGRAHPLRALDPNAPTLPPDSGVDRVATVEDLAECGCVFLSLPSASVVEAVLFGRDPLARHLRPGTIVVDTSTVEYEATLSIADRLGRSGLRFLDAPVSGMRKRAEDGTLTMMVGGDAAILGEVRVACEAMASTVLHVGPTGGGQLTKLINQLLFDVNAAALAEVLPMAVKLGLDATQVGHVVNSGTGRSYASEFFVPNILKGVFDKGYPMEAAYKDLISGAELSARRGIPMPLVAAATATYQRALLDGLGTEDKGAMIKVFERALGVAFRAKDDA